MSTNNDNSRREFLKTSTKAGLALTSAAILPNAIFANNNGINNNDNYNSVKTGFDQTPLGYDYNALDPVIDPMTMEIHYSKHAASYAKTLKEAAAAENIDTTKPVEDVLKNISKYSPKVRNNAGGHYNHELFWKLMKKGGPENHPVNS